MTRPAMATSALSCHRRRLAPPSVGPSSCLRQPEPQAQEVRAPNPAVFEQFSGAGTRAPTRNDIDLVLDIPVQLTVELGRTKLPIRNLLQLEPMDVLVNGCLIAQGEVVVVNEKFGIRLTDVITPSERMKRLGK